jgi:hypothetical protein
VSNKLKQKFRISVIEETPHYLNCKIIRFGRLYAVPVFFPNPTVEISWENSGNGFQVSYLFTCFDYYIIVAIPFLTILSSLTNESNIMEFLKIGIGFGTAASLFFGSLILIDTKYLVYRIKKTLLELNENDHK